MTICSRVPLFMRVKKIFILSNFLAGYRKMSKSFVKCGACLLKLNLGNSNLEDGKRCVLLNTCPHVFHYKCILKHFEKYRKTKCPQCNTASNKEAIRGMVFASWGVTDEVLQKPPGKC